MSGPLAQPYMTNVTLEPMDALGRVPYLATLPAPALRELAGRAISRGVPRDGVVFTEGEVATGLVIVLAGRVKIVRLSIDGREQVLHVEGPGATLGEVPVFDGGGWVATAVAATDARVLWIPRDEMLALCRRHPDIAAGVIAVLARRVRTFAALVAELGLLDVTARVARFLTALPRDGGDVELPGTRTEIAARLGTVREGVSRALSERAAARLVVVRGRRVRVLDGARLAERAEGVANR